MKELYISDLILNKQSTLLCWISNKRESKDVLFLDVYDSTGTIQAVATKEATQDYFQLCKVTKESAIKLIGEKIKQNNSFEFKITSYEIMALATLSLSPSPNENNFDSLDKKYENLIIEHPTFYIRNHKLSSIYRVKANFKRCIQDYFWNKNFMEFEAPTLTNQTLYDDSGAIWLDVDGYKTTLSRCATFHLEPALIAYERLFTITNSHANEKSKSNRHLVEYLHLKAEICWITLDELIKFAQDMFYNIAKETYKKCKSLMDEIAGEDYIKNAINKLNPKNHHLITYDEAVKIIKSKGLDFEYGKSLSTEQEKILTSEFGENFVWVKYIPYKVEGFMFKRNKENPELTQTCDLIAPYGFGEILGCAEKMENYDDIISSMKQKDKFKDYNRYQDFAELHKLGLPYHGGIGMGVERAIRYLLNIQHIKYTRPFAVIKNTNINH